MEQQFKLTQRYVKEGKSVSDLTPEIGRLSRMNREGVGGRPALDEAQAERVVAAMRRLRDDRFDGNGSELARKLGLTPSAVSQAFSRKTTPSYPTAVFVARLLGTTVEALLSGTEDMRLPNRSIAARIALDGGVDPDGVSEVLEEEHPHDHPVLWWIDRMRARALLLVPETGGGSGEVIIEPPTQRAPTTGTHPTTRRVPRTG